MKPAHRSVLVLAAVLCSQACTTTAPPAQPAPASGADGVELEAVMEAIQQALSEAQTQDVPGFPPLESVTVKLQAEASRSVGGQLELYIFSVGSRYTAETASTLELKMKPPQGRPPQGLRPAGDLKQALARAIHLAKVGVAKAAQGSPPFIMTDIQIDLKFTVELGGSAGAKVDLVPLGAEAGGKLSHNQIHSITLVFGK
jgi:Trypsin-co-occurring domain 2